MICLKCGEEVQVKFVEPRSPFKAEELRKIVNNVDEDLSDYLEPDMYNSIYLELFCYCGIPTLEDDDFEFIKKIQYDVDPMPLKGNKIGNLLKEVKDEVPKM